MGGLPGGGDRHGVAADGQREVLGCAVGVFPDPEALLRLADAVLVEAHDECQVSGRRYISEGSMTLLNRPQNPTKEMSQPTPIGPWSPHR
jgi:transposase-like protein